MACVNNGQPAHVHRTSGKESAPDISIVHSSLLDKITWETVNDLGSDHTPIILTYEDEMIKVNNKPRFKVTNLSIALVTNTSRNARQFSDSISEVKFMLE